MSTLQKRSFCLSGHRTSLALEPEFWAILDAMALSTSRSLTSLISEIDRERPGEHALASCLRVTVLRHIIAQSQPDFRLAEEHDRPKEAVRDQQTGE